MKTLVIAALASASLLPAVAIAQTRTAPAVIVVVDRGRILNDCNACKAANTQLQSQVEQLRQRAQALGAPLQTEGQSIQTAINALQGKAPDAALQSRVTAFQQKQQAAQSEVATREQTIQRNRAFAQQQVVTKMNPIITAAMKAHGANLAVDEDATIAHEAALDITNEVLASLNSQLPSVSVTAPAPTPAPPPQGR